MDTPRDPQEPIPVSWVKFWQPDLNWLNKVNTTNYRTVNAIRVFIATSLMFCASFMITGAWVGIRCGATFYLFGWKVFQYIPGPGRLNFEMWRACEESITVQRFLDFASNLFDAQGFIVVAMAGVAVAGAFAKRATDTDHKVRVKQAEAEVERAKKAPVIINQPTGEHQAQTPVVQQNVEVVAPGQARVTGTPTGNARTDDERGEE